MRIREKRDISSVLIAIGLAVALFSSAAEAKGPRINPEAQRLAKLLRPAKLSGNVGEGDLDKASARVIQIITALEKSSRGSRPPPNDLIDNAYKFFLPGVNFRRAAETRQAVLMAWQEARALGLFEKDGAFARKITRGGDVGKDCVFEYIVPAEMVPPFSTDPINVRIVPPSRRRQGGPLTVLP